MNALQSRQSDSWTVAGRTFTSRLIVGTGKYKSFEENAAAVEASGATLSELIDDLESSHPGLKDRLLEAKDGQEDLRRFVNLYVNDEDVRFTGGLGTELSDGDQVVVLPAVAGGC